MKFKSIVLTALFLISLPVLYWCFKFHKVRTQYEAMRVDNNSIEFTLVNLTKDDLATLETVRQSWELRRDSSFPENERKMLRQLGYADDVAGIVDFWSDSMPPFSSFDHDRNALWVARAAYRNVTFPRPTTYKYGNGILFYADDGIAEVFEDVEGDINYSAFSPKNKESDKAEMATPRKPSD